MNELPDLSQLTHDAKDSLIRALWAQVQALTAQVQTLVARVAELEAKLNVPPKTPDNSSLPPSQGKKPNRAGKVARRGPRPGSLGRMGGGRPLAETPNEIVSAKPVRCAHCQAAFSEADHVLHGRYDKIDLPQVVPVVARVERYVGRCRCCGGTTLAPVPEGLEPGTGISHQTTGIWLRMSARTRTSSTASRMVWRMEFLPVTMRTALSATRLSVARLRGPWSRRTSDASSLMVTSRTQCRLFSISHTQHR